MRRGLALSLLNCDNDLISCIFNKLIVVVVVPSWVMVEDIIVILERDRLGVLKSNHRPSLMGPTCIARGQSRDKRLHQYSNTEYIVPKRDYTNSYLKHTTQHLKLF